MAENNNKKENIKNIISQNFDVSIILPFYKKYNDFKRILPINAKYFQRNGIEVIIVMDEPSEKKKVIGLIKKHPFINWRILCNEKDHNWRNPSKAINVGLKNAKKKYVLVMSPESEFYNDVIFKLRYKFEFYNNHFLVGRVVFSEFNETIDETSLENKIVYYYGSIMARREDFQKVKGYNEILDEWGGDDDNLRARMEMAGLRKLKIDDAILIHRDCNSSNNKRNERMKYIPIKKKREILYPQQSIVNSSWGQDFSNTIYDYENNQYAYELCEDYLSSNFLKYKIRENNNFYESYKIIALIQAFNEAELINESLEHIEKYCDGIILIDDESSDGTYELAKSDKLIIKAKKKRKNFDDLNNRNILLNIASFIKSEWFFFMDVDEKFDDRYDDIYGEIEKSYSDVIIFYFINLWDDPHMYRVDYPFFGRNNNIKSNGYRFLLRLFKNIGRMNIYSEKTLHFLPIPYRLKNDKDYYISNLLIKHYGLLTQKKRTDKYNFYKIEDKKNDQTSYEHLLDKNVSIDLVENFRIPEYIPFK